MGTTVLHVTTGLRAAVVDIMKELQDCRDTLPKTGNNRPPLPTDPFARYAQGEIAGNRGPTFKGLEHLMAITLCNITDRMALSEAKRWLRRAERYIDTHAATIERPSARVLPISSAIRREQRANHAFDMAEMRVLEQDTDVDAVRDALEKCREQKTETEATELALEQHLTLLTATPQRLTLEHAR